MLSYIDTCYIGVNIDVAAVPDPENLMADLKESFDEVLQMAAPASTGQETLVS